MTRGWTRVVLPSALTEQQLARRASVVEGAFNLSGLATIWWRTTAPRRREVRVLCSLQFIRVGQLGEQNVPPHFPGVAVENSIYIRGDKLPPPGESSAIATAPNIMSELLALTKLARQLVDGSEFIVVGVLYEPGGVLGDISRWLLACIYPYDGEGGAMPEGRRPLLYENRQGMTVLVDPTHEDTK